GADCPVALFQRADDGGDRRDPGPGRADAGPALALHQGLAAEAAPLSPACARSPPMAEPSLQRVEELFHQAVDLDPIQQAAFPDEQGAGGGDLGAAIEELGELDKKARVTGLLLRSPLGGARQKLAPPPPPLPPTIARYRVVRVLGEGGMGTVYE